MRPPACQQVLAQLGTYSQKILVSQVLAQHLAHYVWPTIAVHHGPKKRHPAAAVESAYRITRLWKGLWQRCEREPVPTHVERMLFRNGPHDSMTSLRRLQAARGSFDQATLCTLIGRPRSIGVDQVDASIAFPDKWTALVQESEQKKRTVAHEVMGQRCARCGALSVRAPLPGFRKVRSNTFAQPEVPFARGVTAVGPVCHSSLKWSSPFHP